MNSEEAAAASTAVREAAGLPETIEVETGPDPSAAVIWLHGLGADGHDFEPLVPELSWPGAPALRFVFPHAPVRPVTLNGGMPMRAWYDIVSLTGGRDHDRAGIESSVGQAAALIRRERERGIAADRIIVAGFSQGGAIALLAALRHAERLGGLIALSTYLLLDHRLEQDAQQPNRDLPVFFGHGSYDPMVPCGLGEAAAARLRELGCQVEWHSYAMPHSVCPQEVVDLTAWLSGRLSAS